MSSGGNPKKAAGSGGPGGQSKSKKLATASGVSKPTSAMNPATQPEFLVEKITGKRYWNGRPQVLIKWQGYPREESTWEPMENIGNCMVLLADFEAELYRSRERKKRLHKAFGKNKTSSSGSWRSDHKLPGATKSTSHASAHVERRVEFGKMTGPKANLTNGAVGSTPKPNANHNVDNHKAELSHISLVKSSKKQEPGPSSSFYKLPLAHCPSTEDEIIDVENLTSESSSESSESPFSKVKRSKAANEMNSLNLQKKTKMDDASIKTTEMPVMQNQTASKKMRRHTNSATIEDSIEKSLKSIYRKPMVTPISPLASSPEISKQLVEKCKINQKPSSSNKNRKKSPKNSDDDSDTPLMPYTRHNKLSEGSGWKVPLRKAPFGLARGLELDKIVHNFKVVDKLYLFVNWKGYSATDVVPLDELKLAYPAQVIQYFENMKRITKRSSP